MTSSHDRPVYDPADDDDDEQAVVFDQDPLDTDPAPEDVAAALFTMRTDIETWFINHYSTLPPLEDITKRVTQTYLGALQADPNFGSGQIRRDLLQIGNEVITSLNATAPKGVTRMPTALSLSPWQVAQILLSQHKIVRIAPSTQTTDREYDLLAMYQETGPGAGTYSNSEDEIRTVARRYSTNLRLADFKEVMAILAEDAVRTTRCTHPDLLVVADGIFNYSHQPVTYNGHTFAPKALAPFTHELVFMSKIAVPMAGVIGPLAPPPVVITNPDGTTWEVTEWIEEFFHIEGDEDFNTRNAGMSDLIWEIISASLRPHVRWNKSAWFYSESGNNGKGTLCTLMRNLIGDQAHTSIPLTDFGKEFALEPLVRASAIIVDENDVGIFIDKAANLKAVVTNDVIQINRKYRAPIAYQFWGFMVQCLNELPLVRDRSDSFYRRQLFVPFTKSFTGHERTYIKNDYLQRPEVLAYVLWYALNKAGAQDPGQFYTFSEPAATKEVLEDYKEHNDPVRAFWIEHREQFAWKLVPFNFAYDCYKVWFPKMNPSGSMISSKRFISDLLAVVRTDPDWYCTDKSTKFRTAGRIEGPDYLIERYDLKEWMNPTYAGSDLSQRCTPNLATAYRGVQRHDVTAVRSQPADDAADADADTDNAAGTQPD